MKSISILATASAIIATVLAAPGTLSLNNRAEDAAPAAFTEPPFPFTIISSDNNTIFQMNTFVQLDSTIEPTVYTLQGTTVTTIDGTEVFGKARYDKGQAEPVVNAISAASGGSIPPLKCLIGGKYPNFALTCKDGVNTKFWNQNGYLYLATPAEIKNAGATPIQLLIVPTVTPVSNDK